MTGRSGQPTCRRNDHKQTVYGVYSLILGLEKKREILYEGVVFFFKEDWDGVWPYTTASSACLECQVPLTTCVGARLLDPKK